MAPLKLTLPLADFEKRLLLDFVTTFGGQFKSHFIDNDAIVIEVFNRWSWADEVIRSFSPTHSDDELFTSHGGGRSLLWESCLSRLSMVRRFDDGPKYSRVGDLRKNNPGYPQEIMTDYDGDILVENLAEDDQLWRIIANVFLAVRYNISSFSNIRDFVDIYQRRGLEPVEYEHIFFAPDGDVRSVALSYLGLGDVPNSIEMEAAVRSYESEFLSAGDMGDMKNMQALRSANKFWQRMKDWKEDKFDIWSLLRKAAMIERGGRQGDKIWAALDECRFVELYENMAVASVCGDMVVQDKSRLPQWKFFSSINDPSTYVEFIPWVNLVTASPSHTITWLDHEIEFVTWRPVKASKFDYLMYTSEETYRYLVTLGLTWPNHMASEYVLFALLPLKDSAFIQDLSSFGSWFFWNDCAITQHPDTKEWKLLQTISGLKFHHVAQKSKSMDNPRKHFSQTMDRLRFGSPEKLHEILGLEDPLKYEQLVDVIPCQQLVSVNPEPIGKGARGIVYKAVWKCPQMTDMPGPEEVTVVLKAMKASDPNHLKRFFQELDANLALLRTANIGGMRFFGVMKTPSLSANGLQSTSDSFLYEYIAHLPEETLFLVSKYATEGNLFQYLTSVLTGIAEDWKTLVYLMMCVAFNTARYHLANIVHRDISVNNILIDKESQPSSGPGGIIVKLSDLGESIQLEGPKAKFPYYGDQQSSALGVSPYGQHSEATDFYSFRSLLALMVRKMWEVSKQKQGIEDHRVPKCIVKCMEWCRSIEKLRMSDLASELDKALFNVEDLTSQMENVDPDSLDDTISETGSSMAKPSSIETNRSQS